MSKQQTTLSYELEHTGLFSSEDGSDITIECLIEYNNGFDSSTAAKVRHN